MLRVSFAAMLVLASGCSLILDFDEGASSGDAGADSPFTQAECDFGEPNDSVAEPAMIEATEVGPAAVCARMDGVQDRDFYRFTVPPDTATVSIRISFVSSSTGDLDLRLYDPTGATVLGMSVGFMDVEEVVCPAPDCNQNMPLPAGDYLFEVFSAVLGGGNRYDMALTLTPI